MRFFIIAALLLAPSAVIAQEAPKPPKPVVCVSYALATTKAGTVAICYDNKAPFLMTAFQEVDVPGKESGKVRVLVGWR